LSPTCATCPAILILLDVATCSQCMRQNFRG
jgi:hypothetical protein